MILAAEGVKGRLKKGRTEARAFPFVGTMQYNPPEFWLKGHFMYFVDRSAVVLKPTQVFLDWLKSTDENAPELTLEQIRSNCTVYLVPEFDAPEEVVAYFDERYEAIFRAEVSAWEEDAAKWPKNMDLQAFWQFFDVEINDMVLDMEDADMQVSPVFDHDR